MALISRGIELYFVQGSMAGPAPAGVQKDEVIGGFLLSGLQEVGELSGLGAGVARDKIEVTTLADDKHVYVDGIQSDSDLAGITFKFLMDTKLFAFFKNLADYQQTLISTGDILDDKFLVRIPTGKADDAITYSTFTMKANVTDLKMDGAGVNAALTMSVTLTPREAITLA